MQGNVEVRPEAGNLDFEAGHAWQVPGGYAVRFSSNGNLEVCNPHGRVVWESGTADQGGSKLAVQQDGNVVIYARAGRPIWSTHTNGHFGAFLALQEDGNMVVYGANGKAIWATGTARK